MKEISANTTFRTAGAEEAAHQGGVSFQACVNYKVNAHAVTDLLPPAALRFDTVGERQAEGTEKISPSPKQARLSVQKRVTLCLLLFPTRVGLLRSAEA